MVTKISIHKHNVVVPAPLKTMDVCRTEAQFACSCSKNDLVRAVDLLQILDSFLSAIWRVIINDDDFHFNLPVISKVKVRSYHLNQLFF